MEFMKQDKEVIWVYYSMHRQNLDNDYIFYRDGTILHHYDRTMTKWNIKEHVNPSDISGSDKKKIISKCESECTPEVVNQIKRMLDIN